MKGRELSHSFFICSTYDLVSSRSKSEAEVEGTCGTRLEREEARRPRESGFLLGAIFRQPMLGMTLIFAGKFCNHFFTISDLIMEKNLL